MMRIWFAGSRHPSAFALFRSFGPTGSRFDHHGPGPGGRPQAGDRAILYAVDARRDRSALVSAIAEVFQQTRTIDLAHEEPHLSAFTTALDIPLLNLAGHWATRVGGSLALSAGTREAARGWSRAFYKAYPRIGGLRYRSSMSGGSSIAVAFYERALPAMPGAPDLDLPLAHPALRRDVVRAAGILGFQIAT